MLVQVTETVIQDNLNPIENVERSALVMAPRPRSKAQTVLNDASILYSDLHAPAAFYQGNL